MRIRGPNFGTQAGIEKYLGDVTAPGQMVWSTDGLRMYVFDGKKQGGYAFAMQADLTSLLPKNEAAQTYATKTELTDGLATKQPTGDYATKTELNNGLNGKAFQAGSLHCELEDLDWHNPVPYGYPGTGCNVLPNGDLVGMENIHHKYGTVLSTREEVLAKQREWGDLKACSNTECVLYRNCKTQGQNRSDQIKCAILYEIASSKWRC